MRERDCERVNLSKREAMREWERGNERVCVWVCERETMKEWERIKNIVESSYVVRYVEKYPGMRLEKVSGKPIVDFWFCVGT